jgi:hypothetical protein
MNNFLGQSLDESQFNVNLRTRRQRIVANLSFETAYHNVYDPCYSSDNDSGSVDLNDSSSSSSFNDDSQITSESEEQSI